MNRVVLAGGPGIKEVDAAEQTTRFWQEIYNEHGMLVEVHEKFPQNRGHRPSE